MDTPFAIELVTAQAHDAIEWAQDKLWHDLGRIVCYPLAGADIWYLKIAFKTEDAAALFKLFWYV